MMPGRTAETEHSSAGVATEMLPRPGLQAIGQAGFCSER